MRTVCTPILAFALALGATLLLSPRPAHACSCMMQGPKEAFDEAAAVFEGRVVAIKSEAEGAVGPADKRVLLRVVRAWKGIEAEQVQVTTADNSAMCGYHFEPEKSYLVYAHGNDEGGLRVSLCSRTKLIEQADEDLSHLGAGVTTFDPESPAETDTVGEDPGTDPSVPQAGGTNGGSAGCQSCAVGAGRSGVPGAAAVTWALLGAAWWFRRRR